MAVNKIVYPSREEWLDARKNKIGGSDVSSIVGMNPYMNNQELYMIKTGQVQQEDISEKPYVKYGTEAEQYLRELFKLDFPQYEVEYDENNMFTNDELPFTHASLDGVLIEKETGRKGILEIKTTNILRSQQKEKWKDKLPDNYYCQVIHYLLVTGYDFAILKAQLKSEFNGDIYLQTKHYRIERSDVEEDIKFLEKAERQFWKCVKEKKKPSLILPEL